MEVLINSAEYEAMLLNLPDSELTPLFADLKVARENASIRLRAAQSEIEKRAYIKRASNLGVEERARLRAILDAADIADASNRQPV